MRAVNNDTAQVIIMQHFAILPRLSVKSLVSGVWEIHYTENMVLRVCRSLEFAVYTLLVVPYGYQVLTDSSPDG